MQSVTIQAGQLRVASDFGNKLSPFVEDFTFSLEGPETFEAESLAFSSSRCETFTGIQ